MADTSQLNKVTNYIVSELSKKYGVTLKAKKVAIGDSQTKKQFSAVSSDGNLVMYIYHGVGLKSSGSSGKINSLYAKCFFLDKVKARTKMIYFTNEESYRVFKEMSKDILVEIQLEFFDGLPEEYMTILRETNKGASKEMKNN